jgi:hypothetical protein
MGFKRTSAFSFHAKEISGIESPVSLLLIEAVKVPPSNACKAAT